MINQKQMTPLDAWRDPLGYQDVQLAQEVIDQLLTELDVLRGREQAADAEIDRPTADGGDGGSACTTGYVDGPGSGGSGQSGAQALFRAMAHLALSKVEDDENITAYRENDQLLAEIDRLRKCCTQRGARMQIMREWMAQYGEEFPGGWVWWWFCDDHPDAGNWFDQDGVPVSDDRPTADGGDGG